MSAPAISGRAPFALSERQSLAIVTGAHLIVLAALSLALRAVPPPPVAEEAVAVEVVSAGDAEPPPTAPPPQPKAVETPPPPEPAPPEAVPPLPEPVPAPMPARVDPPKPATPVEKPDAPPEKPKPEKKPEPAPKPVAKPEPPRLDTDALSSLLDTSVKKARPRPLDTAALAKAIGPVRPASKFDPAALAKALGPAAPKAMRATPGQLAAIAAAIKAQVQPCWNPPLGGTGKMTAVLHLDIARDGSVARPSVVSQTGVTAANGDYARTFAETARRAVLRCAPLKLPADSYELWKAVEINFDPSEL